MGVARQLPETEAEEQPGHHQREHVAGEPAALEELHPGDAIQQRVKAGDQRPIPDR